MSNECNVNHANPIDQILESIHDELLLKTAAAPIDYSVVPALT